MLHEVLLCLAGHPSPICSRELDTGDAIPFLTPAERTLLGSVGRVGELHRALKSHLSKIRRQHPSVICKAVANAVLTKQLSRFQQHVEDVERRILTNDATMVGALDIVPLASVVQEFEIWRRRIDYYWDLACFMSPVEKGTLATKRDRGEECLGTELLGRLRKDMNTGYPDIEEDATDLLVVGEQVLFRLLSSWVLTGRLSDLGKRDFFVQDRSTSTSSTTYVLDAKLIPSSIVRETALSILFVGRTLTMLQPVLAGNGTSKHVSSFASDIRATTMHHLKEVAFPMKSAVMSAAISSIRRNLSWTLGNTILPTHALLHILSNVRSFMLAGRSDFMDALIEEADRYLDTRYQQTRIKAHTKQTNELAGITMKENEVKTVMNRAWTAIEAAFVKHSSDDDEIEWARDHVRLFLSHRQESLEDAEQFSLAQAKSDLSLKCKFDDFLLATPVSLGLSLDPTFDLFLPALDRQIYSSIHAYLLAIRRAHNHTSALWKEAVFRLNDRGRKQTAERGRVFITASMTMRKLLATCSAVVFTLSEIGTFFADEVIQHSWTTFQDWTKQLESTSETCMRSPSNVDAAQVEDRNSITSDLPHDPETLAIAHHQFLQSLAQSILLTDESWARSMRSLLTFVDQMVAFVKRLQLAQQNIVVHGENLDDHLRSKYVREEQFLYEEARKSCDRVEEAIKALIERLEHISLPESSRDIVNVADGAFEPWHPGNGAIERLLLRLDMRPVENGTE
jgi:hypothetical protein